MYYLKDPKTKERSVTLTMLAISFVVTTVASIYMFVTTGSSSLLETQFFTIVGLYFGRKFTTKDGKVIDSSKEEKTE